LNAHEKPLVWLRAEIKTPPFSKEARVDAGGLLGRLQQGESISLPHSRPMSSIGPRCYELRIDDGHTGKSWRIFYRLDQDAIVIALVEPKATRKTPRRVIDLVKRRLKQYDES
jgi:phage-related protein